MREIDLREFYPEIYKEDYVVSLPDEIVATTLKGRCVTMFLLSRRS